MRQWNACLIDAPTQSGKTRACLELLEQKVNPCSNTLVIFITQANSTSSVDQFMQRASSLTCIKTKHIFKSTHILPSSFNKNHNIMLVDFWNARNTRKILKFVQSSHIVWSEVIVIIDEADQGNLEGVRTRLTFLTELEKVFNRAIKVVFITATVANLSKQLYQINKDSDLTQSKLLSRLLTSSTIEHYYANPIETYIGASWYYETPDVWKPLVFPKECKDIESKNTIILNNLKGLPESNKILTLMAVSNLIEYHNDIAPRILSECGYNVVVKLNNVNGKNYHVLYKSNGEIFEWTIPFKELDYAAENGGLGDNIKSKYDYTLSHVLHASIFTDDKCQNEFYDNIITFYKPSNFPKKKKVKACLIAGNLANRGISIQNPHIGFVCTSYCLTDLKDTSSRGAANTQRFGRACGMLFNKYNDSPPVLIASENILRAAIANEISLKNVSNKSHVCLKDLIPAAEWKQLCANVKRRTTRIKDEIQRSNKKKGDVVVGDEDNMIDGVSLVKLMGWMNNSNAIISKMVRYLYEAGGLLHIHEMMQGIEYNGNEKEFQTNIDSGRSVKCNYGKLWCARKDTIYMNPNIRDYLNNALTYIK
jgi:archaellum biogenesis ATPase FlaH